MAAVSRRSGWADSFSTGAGKNTAYNTNAYSVDVTDSTVVIAGAFNSDDGQDAMQDKSAAKISPLGAEYTGFVVELTADSGLYHFASATGAAAQRCE